MNYAFPSEDVRQRAIYTRQYIVENNLPLGLEVWKDKLFITVPRWKTGVAASLNYINITDKTESPLLMPYPDWTSHNLTSFPSDPYNRRIRIISPFRVRADECDRLWVLDSGLESVLDSPRVHRPTSLLIFDLQTDKLLRYYQYPTGQYKSNSFFGSLAVDVNPTNCADTFVYTADLAAFGMVVYDWQNDKSWRIEHHYFNPDPIGGDFNVAGLNFQWTDGVFGVALGKRESDGFRDLYFHSFSGSDEFKVSTKILRESGLAEKNFHEFKHLGSRGKNGHASASFLHEKTGILFYTQVIKNAIGCWNINKTPYIERNQGLAYSDNITMIFPNDVKVDRNDNLWVLTDKMPEFLYSRLNPDDINYRVLMAPVEEAVRGTVCDANYKGGATTMKLNVFCFSWAIVMLTFANMWRIFVE